MDADQPSNLGWWTISGESLLDLLRQVEAGESPDIVYAQNYANSVVTRPGLTDE
jgi:hypothetical protein